MLTVLFYNYSLLLQLQSDLQISQLGELHTNLKIFSKSPRDFNGREDRFYGRRIVSKNVDTVLNNGCFIVKREAGGAEVVYYSRSGVRTT